MTTETVVIAPPMTNLRAALSLTVVLLLDSICLLVVLDDFNFQKIVLPLVFKIFFNCLWYFSSSVDVMSV